MWIILRKANEQGKKESRTKEFEAGEKFGKKWHAESKKIEDYSGDHTDDWWDGFEHGFYM